MKISRKQLKLLVDNINDFDRDNFDELEVRENYSGRFMYGKSCIGFVTNNPVAVHGMVCAILATWEAEHNNYSITFWDGPGWYDLKPQTDSMGLSSILYYPILQLED